MWLFRYVRVECLDIDHLNIYLGRVYPDHVDIVIWENLCHCLRLVANSNRSTSSALAMEFGEGADDEHDEGVIAAGKRFTADQRVKSYFMAGARKSYRHIAAIVKCSKSTVGNLIAATWKGEVERPLTRARSGKKGPDWRYDDHVVEFVTCQTRLEPRMSCKDLTKKAEQETGLGYRGKLSER